MSNYKVSELFVYPIKSLGGISLNEAEVTDRGFKYDRRWMLIDSNGNFLSQRKIPQMALISVDIYNEKILLRHKKTSEQIEFDINETTKKKFQAKVWDNVVDVLHVNSMIDDWLSMTLNAKCKLVFMPDETVRPVDKNYAIENERTSLSDGYPFLIIGQESLNDLNSRLIEKVGMDRFRPNIVFVGGEPFDEDKFNSFKINDVIFYSVKPCSRCLITTTDQSSGERKKEPLSTLSTYRAVNNKVLFGQNLLHKGNGAIKTNDELEILSWKK